jgi:hypothetical protein
VLAPESSPFEDEIIIAKLKNYKYPASDQILAKLIQVRGIRSTNSLIVFGVKKNCLLSGKSLLLYKLIIH